MKKPFGKHGDGTIFQREGIFDWDYKIGAFRTGLERDKDCKTGQAFVHDIGSTFLSASLPFFPQIAVAIRVLTSKLQGKSDDFHGTKFAEFTMPCGF